MNIFSPLSIQKKWMMCYCKNVPLKVTDLLKRDMDVTKHKSMKSTYSFKALAKTKKTFLLLLAIVLFVQVNKAHCQDVSGFLPDEILIRTHTQSYCKYFQFTLVDGRIYSKKTGDKEWKLFLGRGLPFSKMETTGKDEFPTPKRVSEISADADSLYVFDDEGILYSVFLDDSAPQKPFRWRRSFGFPRGKWGEDFLKQDELVRDKRAWSMACRRKDILYHTDIYGNEHHYGKLGLETMYFLTADGKRIHFTDSGLPANFSHQIQTPLNGTFVSQSLSASGSTVFVIGSKGTMFTRLIDFDTMGCDPMFFQYTYDKLEQKKTGKQFLSNYSPWALPAEPWYKQPNIPLEGKARITRIISIAQNGQGNAARVLRVCGVNEKGDRGFFEKQLYDAQWTFVKADVSFSDEDFLDSTEDEMTGEVELSYSGSMVLAGQVCEGIRASISGVSLLSEDECILRLSDGNQEFSCVLFAVEKWTYIRHKNPGFDGTPRNYFVTAQFDEQYLAPLTGEFGDLLRRIFTGQNHALFAFSGEGNQEYFEVEIELKKSKSRTLVKNPLAQSTDTCVFFMSREGSPATSKISYSSIPLLKDFDNEQLLLEGDRWYSIRERSFVESKLAQNIAFRDQFLDDLAQIEELKKNARHTRWGYSLLDFLTTITLLNKVNYPKIKNITSFGTQIVDTNFSSFDELMRYRNFVYQNLLEILDVRISCYEKIIADFDDNKIESYLTDTLRGDFPSYFQMVHLPQKASSFDGGDTLQWFPDLAHFPILFYQTQNGTSLTVVLQDSAKSIFEYVQSSTDAKGDPLVIKAYFLPGEVSPQDLDERKVLKKIAGKKGHLEWDGAVLKVCAGKRVLFRGRADPRP